MLQLVGPDWSSDAAGEQSEDCDEPRPATPVALRQIASELLHQVPVQPDEGLAVLEHLDFLVRWRAGMIAEAQQAAQPRQDAGPALDPLMLVALTYVSTEERLRSHGYVGTSTRYTALLVRRGYLSPKHFKA